MRAGGRLFLGFDIGTQGTKGLALDPETGSVVARAAASYGTIRELPPGHSEQDPQTWIDALSSVSRKLVASPRVDAALVGGVGISGQQHGLVALDARGRPVRPAKLWNDTSTASEAAELERRLGRRVPTGFTASKVLWLARREPQSWRATRTVLLPHDYANFRLTDERAMEPGDASGTGFFNPASRRFDEEAMNAIDARLPELVPDLIQDGAAVGGLTAEGADLLGLRPGVPVAAGGGDNMMSAIGSGATREGVVVVSLGTSGTAFTYSARPIIDPSGLIAPFCDSTGGWLPMAVVMNMTGVTAEIERAFARDHAALTEAARAVEPGCGGVLLVPYLSGERVPDLPDATGSLVGLRAGSFEPGVLYRAAMEGTTANLAWGIDRMRELGVGVDRVRAVGGGSQNRLWLQILADTLGVPVERPSEPESAALGAAIQAAWTVARQEEPKLPARAVSDRIVRVEGEPVAPDPEKHPAYADVSRRLREFVGAFYDLKG